jgi:hypothetical protein
MSNPAVGEQTSTPNPEVDEQASTPNPNASTLKSNFIFILLNENHSKII